MEVARLHRHSWIHAFLFFFSFFLNVGWGGGTFSPLSPPEAFLVWECWHLRQPGAQGLMCCIGPTKAVCAPDICLCSKSLEPTTLNVVIHSFSNCRLCFPQAEASTEDCSAKPSRAACLLPPLPPVPPTPAAPHLPWASPSAAQQPGLWR